MLLGNGTWMDNLAQLNSGRLIRLRPDTHDTFYVKSLVTPQEFLMDYNMKLLFMEHLATEGFSTLRRLYGENSSQINAIPWMLWHTLI
ncbi:hypothetical protein B0H19DRAFT_1265731 [Mycena capillaripes]|nr:hypothetical protein B0H19DRAFT_1265731 [Mycena capillaripes]